MSEQTPQKQIIVTYVGAPWCKTCRTFKPTYNPWQFSKSSLRNVTFNEINFDEINEEHTYFPLIKKMPSIIIEFDGYPYTRRIFNISTFEECKSYFEELCAIAHIGGISIDDSTDF